MSGDTSAGSTLQPGQIIRPQMTEDMAREMVENLYGLKVKSIKELNSYDDKNYLVRVDSKHTNPHIDATSPDGYVLKVLNSLESPKKHVEAEHEMIHILIKHGIGAPAPVLNCQGKETSREKIFHNSDDFVKWKENNDCCGPHGLHLVRLLKFVQGKMLVDVPYTPSLLYQVGMNLGRMHKAWKDLSHPALANHQTVWSLGSVPRLQDFLYAVTEESNHTLMCTIMDAFSQEVLPNEKSFKRGVIHGDYNEQNILVRAVDTEANKALPDTEKQYEFSGVIDFGDAQDCYYVYDLAISIMYCMVESKVVDPLEVGGHVLAGYLMEMDLNQEEFDALKTCVAARCAQSLTMGAYSYSMDPGNEYLLVTAKRGWPLAHRIWETPKEDLYASWRHIISGYKS